MRSCSREQVDYQNLLVQLSASFDLLERLRAEPEPPLILIERLEAARLRMINALSSCEPRDQSS